MRENDPETSTTMTYHDHLTRRWFFKECGVGLGAIALHSLLQDQAVAAPTSVDPMAPRQPHFPAKAKNVIFLFMAGGPSHLELFDNKPALARYDGTLPPAELLQGYRAAFIRPDATFLGPKFKFARHGRCGVSSLNCCRTWAAVPTTSPSSSRWPRTPSTTRRLRSS
jgi:hypothetical protein